MAGTAMNRFIDRYDPGRALARELAPYAGRRDVVILALPRGGVPIGHEVASSLRAPLDVFAVRKLGAPWNPEFALGALGSGGVAHVDRSGERRVGGEGRS